MLPEWYHIEKRLQDDAFWYFFNPKEKIHQSQSRIDSIFHILAKSEKGVIKGNDISENNKYFSFYVLEKLIKQGNDSDRVKESIWDEAKKIFEILNDLYNERKYFHLVGYLIHSGIENIGNILKEFKLRKKKEFEGFLKESIGNKTGFLGTSDGEINLESISELSYDTNRKEILRLLLLFNIILTHKSNFARFPFDIYVNEKWSVEHIHARSSRSLTKEGIRKLLTSYKIYLEQLNLDENRKDELKKRIESLLEKERISEHEISTLEDELFKEEIFGEEVDTIDNLALLPKHINSSLSNLTFDEKRQKILQFDKDGSFIPIGTKYVFFKYFTKSPTNLVKWTAEDRKSYLKFLKETIEEFFKNE
jgi:hypothetical protein